MVGCDPVFADPISACEILDKYSKIMLVGDSISAHAYMGLIAALTGNIITGSVIDSGHPSHFCVCDGQWSEHSSCRARDGLMKDTTPHDMGMCPFLPYSNKNFTLEPFTIRFIQDDPYVPLSDWSPYLDCKNSPKPVLIVLQGGSHLGADPQATFNLYLDTLAKSPQYQECIETGRLKLVWTAFHSQSRVLDARFPVQNRDVIHSTFNPTVQRLIQQAGIHAKIIDWWRLTEDAQTSDGFHHLTDVNLLKAWHLIHLADLFTRE
jgi:hypothetical protein